jgi:hypothetical protein
VEIEEKGEMQSDRVTRRRENRILEAVREREVGRNMSRMEKTKKQTKHFFFCFEN